MSEYQMEFMDYACHLIYKKADRRLLTDLVGDISRVYGCKSEWRIEKLINACLLNKDKELARLAFDPLDADGLLIYHDCLLRHPELADKAELRDVLMDAMSFGDINHYLKIAKADIQSYDRLLSGYFEHLLLYEEDDEDSDYKLMEMGFPWLARAWYYYDKEKYSAKSMNLLYRAERWLKSDVWYQSSVAETWIKLFNDKNKAMRILSAVECHILDTTEYYFLSKAWKLIDEDKANEMMQKGKEARGEG